mgnify:FL=1
MVSNIYLHTFESLEILSFTYFVMTKFFKRTTYPIFILFALVFLQTSCNKNNNQPQASIEIYPSIGSTSTTFTLDATGSWDEEDESEHLQIRFDWEHDGVWETEWVTDKVHENIFSEEGEYIVNIEIKDTHGEVSQTTANLTVTNSSDLIPSNSPFSYNVGINYETWANRKNRNIEKDLDEITKYFKLIRTYHDVGIGTPDTIISPTLEPVIKYILAHPELKIELSLGTATSALNIGNNPGFMVNKTYTDKWVQVLTEAFGSVENTKKYVKVILLGNEVDRVAPGDAAAFKDYITKWIPHSFENMKASLAEAGMPEIPVSTTISNYPADSAANPVSFTSTKYINEHWSSQWNSGQAFVFFNHYTEDMNKTDFGYDIKYFHTVDNELGGSPSVYVGETGYDATFGEENQVKVINQIFSWLDGQYGGHKTTIPLFLFQAFDQPFASPGKPTKFGIFEENAQNIPQGPKKGISIPVWISKPKG